MSENQKSRPGVFLDRDGTIADEVGYMNHISRFRLFPFAAAAIRKFNDANIPVFVVTNQSGVSRRYFPESLVRDIHATMTQQLSASGARLSGIYYCPHASSDNCACRKPALGMLEQASSQHAVDLEQSFVVGDRYSDIELAHRARARAILVRTGYGEGELLWHAPQWKLKPDFVADNLSDAADWVLEQHK